jgi:hypothetical protein
MDKSRSQHLERATESLEELKSFIVQAPHPVVTETATTLAPVAGGGINIFLNICVKFTLL